MLIGQHAAIYLSLTLIIEKFIVALTLIIAEGIHQQRATSQVLKQTLHNVIKKPGHSVDCIWHVVRDLEYSSSILSGSGVGDAW